MNVGFLDRSPPSLDHPPLTARCARVRDSERASSLSNSLRTSNMSPTRDLRALCASCALVAAASAPLAAQSLQATLYQSGFSSPVGMYSPPGDLARQFVVEQTSGKIKIIK